MKRGCSERQRFPHPEISPLPRDMHVIHVANAPGNIYQTGCKAGERCKPMTCQRLVACTVDDMETPRGTHVGRHSDVLCSRVAAWSAAISVRGNDLTP